MGGNELGIDAGRVDHGEAADQSGQDGAPDQGRLSPAAGEPSAGDLAVSIAIAIAATAMGAPGNSTVIPRIEK
jgi:hypothetical protein